MYSRVFLRGVVAVFRYRLFFFTTILFLTTCSATPSGDGTEMGDADAAVDAGADAAASSGDASPDAPEEASADSGDAFCQPKECAYQGKNCGSIDDGCGRSLDCGRCADGLMCEDNTCRPDWCSEGNAALLEGDAIIFENDAREDLLRLGGIAKITGDLDVQLTDLADFEGLECLVGIDGDLRIGVSPYGKDGGNRILSSLEGLDNLVRVGGSLIIRYNDGLDDLPGLGGLSFVGDAFSVGNNEGLQSLNGIARLRHAGNLADGLL